MKRGRARVIVSMFAILVSGLVASVPRRARADETVGLPVEPLLLGALLDFTLLAVDVGSATRREWPSRGYGACEAAVGAAQLVISVQVERGLNLSNAGSLNTIFLVSATLGGAFLVHGLITLVAPRTPAEAPRKASSVTLAPVALADVARPPVPGLALAGRF